MFLKTKKKVFNKSSFIRFIQMNESSLILLGFNKPISQLTYLQRCKDGVGTRFLGETVSTEVKVGHGMRTLREPRSVSMSAYVTLPWSITTA